MRKPLTIVLAALVTTTPMILSTSAVAQPYDDRWDGDRDGNWDPSQHYRDHDRRWIDRNERVYRGSDGRYYCKRSNGTTGLVLGAVGGGLLGSALGGSTLGTLLGAGGGALLGKNLDQHHDEDQNRRNGYVCD
ncbi:glycine zipper domain-containing protein [Flavisphingomonas formosensis]|uniref:glycine zipper domain-containing protein n=1 Tax=Flavisphingomonas formosensis TaxID=861534 RepID=UPI0012F740F6|nr:glycine zipper domain-containing protein [Sphingomonas formosensis]